jgi:hypothetical protein
MHLHANPNRLFWENAPCNAALQIRTSSLGVR